MRSRRRPPRSSSRRAGAAPEKPALAFQNDAGLIIFYIKPDKTADFEDLMNKLKDGAREDGRAGGQAAGRQHEALQEDRAADAQMAIYVLVADPVVKDVEYWFLPILYKAYPTDAQALLREVAGRQGGNPGAADDLRPRAGHEVPVSVAQAAGATGPSVRSLACSSRTSRPKVRGTSCRPPFFLYGVSARTSRSRLGRAAGPGVAGSVIVVAGLHSKQGSCSGRRPTGCRPEDGPQPGRTSTMDFRTSEQQEILRRTVREFAEAEIRPHVMAWDEAQHFPSELVPRLAALGLMGIQIPEEYGGAGMSAVDYCICIEELARVDPSVALSVAAHNGLCTAHIFMFGTEAQKRRYVVPLARGEQIGAWGLTEPQAGSDAGAHPDARRARGRAAGCSTARRRSPRTAASAT